MVIFTHFLSSELSTKLPGGNVGGQGGYKIAALLITLQATLNKEHSVCLKQRKTMVILHTFYQVNTATFYTV